MVILDGVQVSEQQLQEAMNNPNVRIVKVSEGVYKTLQKLNG